MFFCRILTASNSSISHRSTVSYRELSVYHSDDQATNYQMVDASNQRLQVTNPSTKKLPSGFSVSSNLNNKQSLATNSTIRVLNVPLLAILNQAKSLPTSKKIALDFLIMETKSSLFVER